MQDTTLSLGSDNAGQFVTAHDFAHASFDAPFTYERVKGRLVVMSPAGPEHRKVSRPFRRALGAYWGNHPDQIDDVDVEGWVSTSDDDDRIPDICVYLASERSGQEPPQRVPELIFEFVSTSRLDQERDYIHKRSEYHGIGVREYVIVDRLKSLVVVLTWAKDDYTEQVLTAKDSYSTPLLPGLEVLLSEAFEE